MMATTNTMKRGAGWMLGLGMGLSIGCLSARPDPNHCLNLDGDRTCAERYAGERVFCSTCAFTPTEDGCVADRPDDACHSPCGGGAWLDEDASCVGESSSSSGTEASSTSGETMQTETGSESGSESSTTGPMPCMGSEDCTDAAAPFCEPVGGVCVACDGVEDGDAACAELDPGMPLCVAGDCVQCTAVAPEACTGETPVCEEATNACVPCVAHAE